MPLFLRFRAIAAIIQFAPSVGKCASNGVGKETRGAFSALLRTRTRLLNKIRARTRSPLNAVCDRSGAGANAEHIKQIRGVNNAVVF
jgi:hypothetical protein